MKLHCQAYLEVGLASEDPYSLCGPSIKYTPITKIEMLEVPVITLRLDILKNACLNIKISVL